MVKITGISGSNNINQKSNIKGTDSDLFQKTLDKALQIKNESKTNKTEKSVLGEIKASILPGVEEVTHGLNEKTSNLLNKIDAFVAALNDPYRSLKDIEPVVTSMKNDADEIMENIEKEEVKDKKLKEIVTESIMTANVEYYKFYRGDYL